MTNKVIFVLIIMVIIGAFLKSIALSIFVSDSEYNLHFSYEKFAAERSYIELQMKDDIEAIALSNRKKLAIGIDIYDLNNDGMDDMIVYLKSSFHCGTAGCLTDFYINSLERSWHFIQRIYSHGKISILKEELHNYHNIKVHTISEDVILRWNGNKYDK